LPKIEEDGKSWLRRPKLYTGVVEPYKKKKKIYNKYGVMFQNIFIDTVLTTVSIKSLLYTSQHDRTQ